MYFLRVDYTQNHCGVNRTRDLVDDIPDVFRLLKELASDPKLEILAVRVERCR